VLIPLWFMGGRHDPPVAGGRRHAGSRPVGIGAYRCGRRNRRRGGRSGLRVAFIASADHGHAHVEGGPYGYHASAAEYDALICELVAGDRLDELCDIPPAMVEDAKADSWWQMLMLHGAIPGWTGRLISYEAQPTSEC